MNNFDLAYKKALKMLSRRPYFKQELSTKLLEKGFQKEDIDQVFLKLEELNFLDDKETIQIFVKELLRKNNGINLIKKKLMSKNVDLNLLVDNFDFKELERDQIKSAKSLLQKKDFNLNNIGDKAKALRFLKNRGFESYVIYNIFRDEDF